MHRQEDSGLGDEDGELLFEEPLLCLLASESRDFV